MAYSPFDKEMSRESMVNMVMGILGVMAMFFLGIGIGRLSVTAKMQTKMVESRQLSDWEVLEMAIIKTESDFNPLARGTCNDLGIFQGTEIWVEEVNRILDTPKYVHTDCLDIDRSLDMFSIIQNHHNPEKDLSKAINLHNPGGDAVGYSIKVRKNMEWVRRYEEIRSKLK